MGRYDNIHGDEDEIEWEYRKNQELIDYDREEQEIEEWKASRID
jgi:hypothetical protein